jgi:hypothetical protein
MNSLLLTGTFYFYIFEYVKSTLPAKEFIPDAGIFNT